MRKSKSVSIIIPVYNEAAHLPACLDAISAQTVMPYEVIVVDNNSTDATVSIAQGYDFVTVVREKRQGVVFARDRGFNIARGSILGRIDADTIMEPDWVEMVETSFLDDQVGAITGTVHYYDIANAAAIDASDLLIRRMTAKLFGSKVPLQGANMAIRRSVWRDIRSHVCHERGMHEDFDLAIHAFQRGHVNLFVPELTVAVGYRHAKYAFPDFLAYALLSPKTYAKHGEHIGILFYPMVYCVIPWYPYLQVLSRGYDSRTGKFSAAQLLIDQDRRVNPATYGDY
jgi:glycosyltransferase involved in cell wall biosynthesis